MLPEARRPSRMPRCRTRRLGCLQDDVGGVARDVGGGHHRDADVGGVQRRRVVDAVAHVADDVAAPLEREDDPVLLRRRDAREHRRLLGQVAERRVVDPGDLVAGHDLLFVEPDRAGRRDARRSSLSPVRILTVTPSRSSSASTSATSGRTGSAKLTKPARTRSVSSSRE